MPDRSLDKLTQTTVLVVAIAMMGLVSYAVVVGDFSKIGNAASLVTTAIAYALVPTNVFALLIEGVLALLGTSMAESRMRSSTMTKIAIGVGLYVAMNIIVNLVFPP